MINSKNISDLVPELQKLAMDLKAEVKRLLGIDILITSTYRDLESQQVLYNQGRSSPGQKVTNAGPGESYHNYRLAFDFVPLINGKAAWENTELFKKIGEIGKKIGLVWGGDFSNFKDLPHFQLGKTPISELKKKIKDILVKIKSEPTKTAAGIAPLMLIAAAFFLFKKR